MEQVVSYIAFDPGEHTGYATFDLQGNVVDFDHVHGREALYELLSDLTFEDIDGPYASKTPVRHVVIEEFLLYPWKDKEQGWSDFETARVIGVIQYWCQLQGIAYTMQGANVKSIAYRWAGKTPTKNKLQSHALDAYVHGVYYLQKLGIRKVQQGRT